MTVRISVRVVAFVIYTVALLAGAFGISYGVFEWRDDGGRSECDIARENYYRGFVTPNVDAEAMAALFEYLQQNCD